MRPVDILEGAADLIETKGWTQQAAARDQYDHEVRPWDDSAVSFCLIGALECAARTPEGFYVTDYDIARKALQQAVPNDGAPLTVWNDTPGRTKEQVVEALRTAAKQIA